MNGKAGQLTKAQNRWKLLREAITQQSISRSEPQFQGYQLIPESQTLLLNADDLESVIDRLKAIPNDCNDIVGFMEVSLLTIVTLSPSCHCIAFRSSKELFQSICLGDVILMLKQRCSLNNCSIHCEHDNLLTVSFSLSWDPSLYTFRQFTVSDSVHCIVRERAKIKLSLEELTSHTRTVDNTGNICIWDCELILTWALQQCEWLQSTADLTIAELGVGMAGLAALSLARKATTIYLTDGHPGSIQNNQINLSMMRCLNMLPSQCSYHVLLLPWSLDVTERHIQADITVVSDCTHFDEYHGALFWTLLACTKVGGTIWMCQPNRGKSLDRFLNLVQAVNAANTHKLVEMEELVIPLVEQKHQKLSETDRTYNANIHRPRIFNLRKLRCLDEFDEMTIRTHLDERDTNIA
jgi:hypothetical protein